MASPTSHVQGPPYTPDTASLGGMPTETLDVPITAIFLALYVCLAVTNITIFRLNRSRGHKFIISGLLGGFCNVRTITCSLRIAWAYRLDNVSLLIAAEILFLAGNLILYIINLVFAQRILRARHPEIGWNRWVGFSIKGLYILVGTVLIMVISTLVLSFFTPDQHILKVCRDIYLFGSSYILFFTTLPFVILLYTYSHSRSSNATQFGQGSTDLKAHILLGSSSLCILIAGFRAGTTYVTPRPIQSSAWYDSKAAFYCFGFVPEILLLLLFVIMRIDLRFKVPDDSSKLRTFGEPAVSQSPVDPAEAESGQSRVTEKRRST